MTQPAKHTPGPWVVDDDYEDEEQQAIGIVKDGHGYIAGIHILASCNNGEGFNAEDRANAALIAAAPAMYADAKQLCELVRDFMNDNRLYDGQVIQAISNLETALSQAEGRRS